jgi:restriction system protein
MDLQQFEILVKDLNYPISNHINKDKDFSDNENQEREISLSMYMKYFYNIEVDYTEDGERIKKLKNILVPSASNEGQSDFINMLLKYNSPETMKLMLIDYSVINYSIYNGVQHLTVPVLTEEKRITSAFEWLSNEMDSRIQKFLYAFVKNIDAYNSKQENENKTILPRIICIINEATSLPNEIDYLFTKLLLNSNMVGIYFVIFSRFGVKSISLGNKMELLEIMDSRKLMSLLTDNENNKQTIIRKNFDDMNGHEFEYYCAGLLKNNGFYDVEVTQGSGDHGIDILAEKDGITYAIQCKCYSSSIGNAAIQQVHTGKSYYKRDIAVVLTNQYFTQQAIEEAKEIGVKLWDRDKLNEMIK